MCNLMEAEINELLSFQTNEKPTNSKEINIDDRYSTLMESFSSMESRKIKSEGGRWPIRIALKQSLVFLQRID